MVDLAFGATAMASIFAIVDPLGVVPFFSVLTEDMDKAQKQNIISKACLTATITLGVFAVFGQWIFAGFGFTIPAFRIAGGIVLFGVAFEMLRGERSRTRLTHQEREETLERDEVAVVPLGIPLLAGPGAITTVMILMSSSATAPEDKLFVFAGILVSVLATYILLHNADRIFRRLGRAGTCRWPRDGAPDRRDRRAIRHRRNRRGGKDARNPPHLERPQLLLSAAHHAVRVTVEELVLARIRPSS